MLFNVFRGSLGLIVGPLGGHLGALLAALGRLNRNSHTSFFFAPWIPKIASRRTLDSPQQRPRRPHREAESPKKPPRPSFRYRRLSVPDDFGPKSTKKRQQGTSPRHFRGDIGAVEFNVFSFVSSLDDLLLLLVLLHLERC